MKTDGIVRIDKYSIIVEDFTMPLSVIDIIGRQKIIKGIVGFSSTINQRNLINIS